MRLLLPLLLLAAPAWAECPTASDLISGIRVRLTDGEATVFRATPDPSLISNKTVRADGGYYVTDQAWGLYDIRGYPSSVGEPGGTTSYGVKPPEMPRPTPNIVVTFAQVDVVYHWPMRFRDVYRMGPLGNLTLADCTYRAFDIALYRTSLLVAQGEAPAPPDLGAKWAYLIDLGIAIERFGSSFGPPEVEVLAIEPLP